MINFTNATINQMKYGKYIVTILHKDTCTEAWLRHEDYGIATLMFGVEDDINAPDLIKLLPDYIATYKEQYED